MIYSTALILLDCLNWKKKRILHWKCLICFIFCFPFAALLNKSLLPLWIVAVGVVVVLPNVSWITFFLTSLHFVFYLCFFLSFSNKKQHRSIYQKWHMSFSRRHWNSAATTININIIKMAMNGGRFGWIERTTSFNFANIYSSVFKCISFFVLLFLLMSSIFYHLCIIPLHTHFMDTW